MVDRGMANDFSWNASKNTNTKDYIIIFSENNIHNSANNKCGLCAHTFVYDQIVLHEQGYGIIYVNGKEQEMENKDENIVEFGQGGENNIFDVYNWRG